MSWFDFTYPFILGCALFTIPGLFITLPLRMRAVDAFGVAPALSVAVSGVSAIIAPMLGIGWSIWVPFAFGALLGLLVFITVSVIRRRSHNRYVAVRSLFKVSDLWFYSAVLLGGILSGLNIITAIGSPDYVSQSFDANFHINAIRFIEEQDNGSSLFLGAMGSADLQPAFYPGVWHGIASLIFESSGADIVGIANIMSVLIGGVVWPVSVLYLARTIAKFSGPVLLAMGAASAAFVAFPTLLMDWGVLYPNMLGVAIMPVGVALVAQFFKLTQGYSFPPALILGLGSLVLIGIALAHPNVLMSLLMVMVPMILVHLAVSIREFSAHIISVRVFILRIIFSALVLLLIWYLFAVLRPSKEAGIWNPTSTSAQAVGEVIANAPMHRISTWFISALMVWGIVLLLTRKNRLVWLPLAWGFIGYFYVSARSLSWEDGRYWVTGVWYNDPYRLSAVLPLFAVIFIGIGLQWGAEKFARTEVSILGRFKPKCFSPAIRLVVFGVIATLAVTYYGQNSKAMVQNISEIKGRYQISENSERITLDEMWLLRTLDQYVPEEDTIIVIPHTGAALAYAISDREVTERHIYNSPNEEILTIREHLNEATTNPEVCKAVDDLDAYYYLGFDIGGIFNPDGDKALAAEYPGLRDVEESGVATEVARAGGAVLYEITACE